jgi:hypothetical protein
MFTTLLIVSSALAGVFLYLQSAQHEAARRSRRNSRVIARCKPYPPGNDECERGACSFPNCPADCRELADAAKACAMREQWAREDRA